MENAELVGMIELLDQDSKNKAIEALIKAGFTVAFINESPESKNFVILQDK